MPRPRDQRQDLIAVNDAAMFDNGDAIA